MQRFIYYFCIKDVYLMLKFDVNLSRFREESCHGCCSSSRTAQVSCLNPSWSEFGVSRTGASDFPRIRRECRQTCPLPFRPYISLHLNIFIIEIREIKIQCNRLNYQEHSMPTLKNYWISPKWDHIWSSIFLELNVLIIN